MFVNGYDLENIRSFPWYVQAIAFLAVLASPLLIFLIKGKISKLPESHKTKIIIGLSILLAVAFVVGFLMGSYGEKGEILQKNSLQVAYNDDFEDRYDPTDIDPWSTQPDNKLTGLISEEEKHFGNHSLRLKVDITNYNFSEIEKREQFGGIGITQREFSEVKAIKAWVLVPKSEQVRGTTFHSHIIASFNDSYFFGEEEEIEPGIWTPIFLGVFYRTENCTFNWDGTIDELYLTVYHYNADLRYKGSIYFDDITIWK